MILAAIPDHMSPEFPPTAVMAAITPIRMSISMTAYSVATAAS